jgi:MFS family permease
MTTNLSDKLASWLPITLTAAAVLMITMGARQSQGLFVFPIAGSTGVGIVTISFAMAVGQFTWGLAQPIAGALADRFGAARVLIGGVLVLAVGTALTPFLTSSLGLVLTIGVFTAMGSGAGSFSVLIGSLSRYLPPAQRGTAAGIITGGGSFGQFVFAPITQKLISLWGWMGAMWTLAALTLLALPLVRPLAASMSHGGAIDLSPSHGGM